MELDISQGPLSDSSKEEDEEAVSEEPFFRPKLDLVDLEVASEMGHSSSSRLTEGLLLSSLVDSLHLEGSETPREESRGGDLLRIHSDRSISPSVSSSISVVSSTGARRNLEWDSGADLGYMDPRHIHSHKPGVELSTLEKLAIRNYKDILEEEKPLSFKRNHKDFEIEKLRLKKFGDFLLRNNDGHFESTPTDPKPILPPGGSSVLRSYESIAPLSPIGSRPSRRSKSWSDVRSQHNESGTSSSFKTLRGSSPIEPSSSSSTGTVVANQAAEERNAFLAKMRDLTPALEGGASSSGDSHDLRQSTTTSDEETKILKLTQSVRVIRSPLFEEEDNKDSSIESAFSCRRATTTKGGLFKLYKSKLSHYIRIISTPSLTHAESKMKQRLAGKLMRLMTQESSESDASSSISSSKLEAEMKKLDRLERKLLKHIPSLALYNSSSEEASLGSACSSVRAGVVSHISLSSLSDSIHPPVDAERGETPARLVDSTSSAVTSMPTQYAERQDHDSAESSSTPVPKEQPSSDPCSKESCPSSDFIRWQQAVCTCKAEERIKVPQAADFGQNYPSPNESHSVEVGTFSSLSSKRGICKDNVFGTTSSEQNLPFQTVERATSSSLSSKQGTKDEPSLARYERIYCKSYSLNEKQTMEKATSISSSSLSYNQGTKDTDEPSLERYERISNDPFQTVEKATSISSSFLSSKQGTKDEPSLARYERIFSEQNCPFQTVEKATSTSSSLSSKQGTKDEASLARYEQIYCKLYSPNEMPTAEKATSISSSSHSPSLQPTQGLRPKDNELGRYEVISSRQNCSEVQSMERATSTTSYCSSLFPKQQPSCLRVKEDNEVGRYTTIYSEGGVNCVKSKSSYYVLDVGSKSRKKQQRNEDFVMSKENRNILSNHVAGLDLAPGKSRRSRAKVVCSTERKDDSLQESLRRHNPSFLSRSRRRVELLAESRAQRLQEQERRNKWLLSVASLSPGSRRRAQAAYVPGRVSRIFNHREMVAETRLRCQRLPEVVRVQRERKQRESKRSNRINLDLYNRKVKSHLLKQQKVRSAH